MKSLRKSLNSGSTKEQSIRHHISTPLPLPPVSKPPASILPPQKVIRALSAYRPQAPQELSFQKGDFFYVIKDVDIGGSWYEAHNPVSGARGLVPKSMFEEFNKTAAPVRTSQVGPKIPPPINPIPPGMMSSTPKPVKSKAFYAVVLHDFVAERTDELDAKLGDPVSIVAQSNREWFVAKPIGRLGRPGLIPISFVQIRDPSTNRPIEDVEALLDREIPKVEEWKQQQFSYKQNTIPLGVIDDNVRAPSNSPYLQPNRQSNPSQAVNQPTYPSITPHVPPKNGSLQSLSQTPCLPDGLLLSADVVSFHYETEEFWFRIDAIFQPYPPPGKNALPPALSLILFRVYNDFYDFQVSLLDTFPREAGREPPAERILPYMPGPVDIVTQQITATRRIELDDYMHKLCELRLLDARYVLEHGVVREFLATKPGDTQTGIEPRAADMDTLLGPEAQNSGMEGDVNQARYHLGQMNEVLSDGSDYEDEGYGQSPQRPQHPYAPRIDTNDRRPSVDLQSKTSLRKPGHAQNHERQRSNSPASIPSPQYRSNSRSESPFAQAQSGYNRWADPAPNSAATSQHSGRSRSHSNAATNLNSPPISAANPQTAFVKIKIFDRVADDLIAIRVHPLVSLAELLDKVQGRLGGEVANLKYRDSMHRGFVDLDGDDALRQWIETTDKHVLYAD